MNKSQPDTIGVLDFGGQYAHLIAKKVRDLGVHTRIFAGNSRAQDLEGLKGIILSGGPADVNAPHAPHPDPDVFNLGIPLLGLCYGHQLLAYHLGGKANKGKTREYGKAKLIKQSEASVILSGLDFEETVWMSHFVTVTVAPPGFEIVGATADCPIAAMENQAKKLYGTQFHVEVTHTPGGEKILNNFIEQTAASRDWNITNYIPSLIGEIREKAKGKNVFMLVSGGVDSTVCFVLLNKALGKERVYGLHIDTGLMRKNESSQVRDALQNIGLDNFHVVDAGPIFLSALAGICDPEEKRRILGKVFLDVQKSEFSKLQLDPELWLLGQGTLYPDTIESGGTANSDTIKTHHNRIPEVEQMIRQGRVIEPLADLYKDEVRKVGTELGLPDELVWRHTFPGPGLAVQQLCSLSPYYPANRPEVEEHLRILAAAEGLGACLLPVRSVGVQGDERTYASVALLWGEATWETLENMSTLITNSIPEINRVVWAIKPASLDPADLSFHPATITKTRLDLHREADAMANTILRESGWECRLYEFPVVMIPVGVPPLESPPPTPQSPPCKGGDAHPPTPPKRGEERGLGESIVLRPLYSENVMTVEFAKLPLQIVRQMADEITALDGIDAVFYDVTNKPPATVQWE